MKSVCLSQAMEIGQMEFAWKEKLLFVKNVSFFALKARRTRRDFCRSVFVENLSSDFSRPIAIGRYQNCFASTAFRDFYPPI
jgi:hypothetical protein